MADLVTGRRILWEQLQPGSGAAAVGAGGGGELRLPQEHLLGRTNVDPQDMPSRQAAGAQGSRCMCPWLVLRKTALDASWCRAPCLGRQDHSTVFSAVASALTGSGWWLPWGTFMEPQSGWAALRPIWRAWRSSTGRGLTLRGRILPQAVSLSHVGPFRGLVASETFRYTQMC